MTFTIHTGDCLEVMAGMEAGSVDAVVTDPPYGVGFKYANDDDSRDGYEDWCLTWLAEARRVAPVVIFTPGLYNLHIYPAPLWTAAYFKPGSTRRNGTGGFNEWEAILVYAERLKLKTDAKRFPDCVNHSKAWETGTHPCPKPLALLKWIVTWLPDGCTILDPFAGSGTTGVAAIELGRDFIGIEREPEYVEIAQRRIEAAAAQGRLPV